MPIGVSDELLGTFVPIAVYWLYSGLYVALDGVEGLDAYRLHPRGEEAARNVVSRGAVVQQAFQVVVALTLFAVILLALSCLYSFWFADRPPEYVALAFAVVATMILRPLLYW